MTTYTDASRGPRLQKVLAEAGVASRRDCEELIESGVVAVNGEVVKRLPAWVDPKHDRITVDGKLVKTRAKHVYVMLYKPRGIVCTNDDPEGRRRAIDLVKHRSGARLFAVGRLDMDSTGLLLLTDDGELANALTHPSHGVHKTYEVTVKGQVGDDALERMERGLFLADRRRGRASRTMPSRLRLMKRDRDRTKLEIQLNEGRNRQIRRMLAQVGFQVKRLRRVRLGPLKLRGLKPGQWRDLLPQEVKSLQRVAGKARG